MDDLGKQICRCIVGACDDTCRHYDAEKSCCVGYGEVVQQTEKVFTEYENYKGIKEQWKLLKLPCTVGDMTYWADAYSLGGIVRSAVVKRIEIDVEGIYVITSLTTHSLDDFGKTVFLSEEAAEAALKNLSQLQSRKQR